MKELFGITNGIICQQVNCCGAYGAGLSGVIAKQYPVVQKAYLQATSGSTPDQLLGKNMLIILSREKDNFLGVASFFTQRNYGNAAHTGKKYTDTPLLISCIRNLCDEYHLDTNIYIPHHVDSNGRHEGIGCGLAGEKWEVLYPQLQKLHLSNLYLIDTFTNEVEKV